MKKGFTLIEIIVSVAIFSVVALFGISSILSLNSVAKKTQSIRTVMDNLNFAVESMSRKMRLGTAYYCDLSDNLINTSQPDQIANINLGRDCSISNEDAISFSYDPKRVTYRYETAADGKGYISVQEDALDGTSYGQRQRLTSPDINIENFGVTVYDTAIGDSKQPRVILVMRGRAIGKEGVESNFSMQTTISQISLEN